ncbi:DciA family protein [Streptomyces sp. NBC_00690]|uniref:DciA family protein n=1 Tax=Streptomyces sp. NBC_00690 TaxID=2975808 RepID=UPI002E2A88DC|nr:DciA family protein [Streptomyces sp. NBC_00690]
MTTETLPLITPAASTPARDADTVDGSSGSSGVDLARVALQAARAAAKNRPADHPGGRSATRRLRTARPEGRDPLTFGAAITNLVTDRAWDTPVTGGSVIDRWASIAPELDSKVRAVRVDPETGHLVLLPTSSAYATQLRLLESQMVTRINTAMGANAVRGLRVLAPGTHTTTTAGTNTATTVEPQAERKPIRTRQTASAGYHEALAAHQATRTERTPDPHIAAANESQIRALRARREPESAFTDARALEDHVHTQAEAAADTHTRALAVARAAKTTRLPEPTRIFNTA